MALCVKILILAICLLKINQSEQNSEVEDQIRRIFYREDVPKYQIVDIKTVNSRRIKRDNSQQLEFEVDEEKIKLQLTPIENNVIHDTVSLWTVETAQNKQGHIYNSEDNKVEGTFYEDPEKMATLIAHYEDGKIYYDGKYGESNYTKVIRSVRQKFLSSSANHVIFNVDKNEGHTKLVGRIIDQPSNQEKITVPLDTLYPKLLIVIDYDLFKKSDENVKDMMEYVLLFWNAINMKYAKLSQPKVKIIVTGIIIVKDPTALQFIYNNRNPYNMSRLDNFNKLLYDQGRYFTNEFRNETGFTNFDASFVMTSLDAVSIAGGTYVGKICDNFLNVGFTKDDGNYWGIQSATHELGHLLNLPHDGELEADKCDRNPHDNSATIMIPYIVSVKNFYWSECSKEILQNFATLNISECLRYPYHQ